MLSRARLIRSAAAAALGSLAYTVPVVRSSSVAMADSTGFETAILASGCFWCAQTFYLELSGVRSSVSGYIGGRGKSPTYEQVSARAFGEVQNSGTHE
jgi:hypothetical protein